MFRKLFPLIALTLASANIASADVLWSTRESITAPGNFQDSSLLGGGFLEDGTMVGGNGPHNISGINVGFYNNTTSAASFDVLVNFYDNVNYLAGFGSPINTTPVGSQYRLHVSNAAAGNAVGGGFLTFGETGLMSLTGGALLFPDSTFAVGLRFVNTNTTTTDLNIVPIFHGYDDLGDINAPFPSVIVGTSNNFFGADVDADGIFSGNDNNDPPNGNVFSYGTGVLAANYYLELQGTLAPEPASIGLLALSGLALCRRRR